MVFSMCGCGIRDNIRRDCHWYHCEHQMGASIDCCTLRENLGDCPCSDDCKDYIGYAEVNRILREHMKHGEQRRIGRWKQLKGDFTTPGGTPYYVCGACGGSGHLNGCEYPRRKVICDACGRINIYPWEKAYEERSSFWEDDEEQEG